MKTKTQFILSFTFVVYCFSCNRANETFDYAYQKDEKIYAYNESSKKDTFLIAGFNPSISPNGQKIAFTKSFGFDYMSDSVQVWLIDLEANAQKKLAVNENHFSDAKWSPDGKYIAFNYLTKDSSCWQIGIIDSDNKNFKSLTNFSRWMTWAYSPTWTLDSKNIITHDLQKISIYQLDGKIIKTYSCNDFDRNSIVKGHHITSNTSFFLTDNKFIFNGESGDTNVVDTSDKDPIHNEAIYLSSLKDTSISRITPKGMHCWGLSLQDNQHILFCALDYKTKRWGAYKIDIDGKNLKLLIDGADEFTGRHRP